MSLGKRTRQSRNGFETANNEFTVMNSDQLLEQKSKKRKIDTAASVSKKSFKTFKSVAPVDDPEPGRFEDEEQWADYELVASRENISIDRAKTIVHLLKEDNTVPFLCRYRRNLIGWDTTPEKLQSIKSAYKEVAEIKTKAQNVIKTLEKKGQLSKEIKEELLKAKSLDTINHLYEPFKERKTTLYQRAVELGLLIPTEKFLNQKAPMSELKRYIARDVKGLETMDAVVEGVKNIISYKISKNIVVLEEMEKL